MSLVEGYRYAEKRQLMEVIFELECIGLILKMTSCCGTRFADSESTSQLSTVLMEGGSR